MLLGSLISIFLSLVLVVLLFVVLNPQKIATEKLQRFVVSLLEATNKDSLNAPEETYGGNVDIASLSSLDPYDSTMPPPPPEIVPTDTPVVIEDVERVNGKYLVQRLSVERDTPTTTAVVFVQGGAFIAAELNATKLQDAFHPLDVLMGADLFLFQYPVRFNVRTKEMIDYIASFLDKYLSGTLSDYERVFIIAYSAGAYLTVKALTDTKFNIMNRIHGACFISGYFGSLSLVDVMYLGPERTPLQNLLNWDRAQQDVTLAPIASSEKVVFMVGSRDPLIRSTVLYAQLCGRTPIIIKSLAHFDLYRPRVTNLFSRYVRQWIASA